MFNFFANLALSIYSGTWVTESNGNIAYRFIEYFKILPIFNIFNNSTDVYYATNTDTTALNNGGIPDLAYFISVILATICCIGVFWMIINAIRKIFSCFLEWF